MIGNFPGLFGGDQKNLLRKLKDHATELSEDDARDVGSLFPDLHLPGLITLLCLGTRSHTRDAAITSFPLTKPHIADALTRLPGQESARSEDAVRAAQLLMTGQFFGDLADAVAAVAHTVPGFPLDIAQDFRSLPRFPKRLLLAIERDLGKDPSAVAAVVRDLREDGRIDSQPTILVNTFRVMFRQATAKKVASTIQTLLGNESVRLAMIVYARSKGVQISQQDLDQVREALQPDEPNLGTLLEPGYQHLMKKFGKDHAMELLGQFVS